jgi:hypothetical protein
VVKSTIWLGSFQKVSQLAYSFFLTLNFKGKKQTDSMGNASARFVRHPIMVRALHIISVHCLVSVALTKIPADAHKC